MKIRIILLVLVPVTAVLLALLAGSAVAWRFFIFCLIVTAVSWLWSHMSLRGITAEASVTAETRRAGETVGVSFSVENNGRIPLPVLEVEEVTSLPDYRKDRAFTLPAHSLREWRAVIPCTHRGSYNLGELDVIVADPLGLFPVRRRFGDAHNILVYPAAIELPFFQVIPRRQMGQSPRRWLASETGASASRVREYVSGDSLRHVHWPTTAHSGRLMVKEFEPERSHYSYHSVRIIADMNADVHHGRGSETTEEIAVTIMASLVKKYLESGKDVGLAAAGDRIYRHEPGHNVEHEQQLFHSLAVMKAQGHIPFARFLAEEAYRFDAGSAVIVVMPAEGQDIAAPLQRAAARGTLVNIILLDSASYGGWTFAQPVARNLASRGLNTYIIRRGDDIASALDSRLSAETVAFAGSEVY